MKKVISVIIDILAWVLLIFAFVITLLVFGSERNNGVPTLLGNMPMSVQSDSMSPTFEKGDLVMVKKVDDYYKLKEGDVISFYTVISGQRVINTHRIVKINEEEGKRSFITRGDNNSIDDEVPVESSDILGKWTKVKFKGLGKFMDFLTTRTGFFICVLIPIAIFFIFELYKFISVLIEAKQIKRSEEDEEEIKRKAVEEYLANQEKENKEEKDKEEEDKESIDELKETVADEIEEKATDKVEGIEETLEEVIADKEEK